MALLKLGKKTEKQAESTKSDPADDVPAELPKLAKEKTDPQADTSTEDINGLSAEPNESSDSNTDEIPDELPALDIEDGNTPEQESPQPAVSEPEQSTEKEIKEQQQPADQPTQQVQTASTSTTKKPENIPAANSKGYFSDLHTKITDKELSAQDLLAEMKNYWNKEKPLEEEIKTNAQEEIETTFNQKLKELQDLENSWLRTRNELEEAKHDIMKIEAEIMIRSEELKTLNKKIDDIKKISKKFSKQN